MLLYVCLRVCIHVGIITMDVFCLWGCPPFFPLHPEPQDRAHGASLRWLIMVEDSETDKVYHSELWTLTKRMASEDKAHTVAFTIPIHHPLPTQHYIRYEKVVAQ